MNEQENIAPLSVVRYVNDMSREERYEWKNYDIPPLGRLETMIDVVKRGLQVDERDKPGVEKDLIALELVSDEAQGIINRSLVIGLATGLLGLTGEILLFSNGGKELVNLFQLQLCLMLPIAAMGLGAGASIVSRDSIFEPMANKFIDKRVKF